MVGDHLAVPELDFISSGPSGLIVGALIGLVLTVLVEDKLKSVRTRTTRRLKLLTRRRRQHVRRTSFSIGPLRTGCHLLEGDGEGVIPEDSISIIVDSRMIELPTELAEWRSEIEATESARRANGERFAWNGQMYAIESFVASRRYLDESPEIFIRLRPADYYTFAATQQLDRTFRDGSTPRSRYLEGILPEDAPGFMACAFGTNMAVVTSDDKLIVSKRSSRVASFTNLWSSSANEALSRSIDSQGRSAPNFYDVARRGLHEELALEPNEYVIDMLAFMISTKEHQWGAAFVVRLKDLTAREVEDRWTRGGPDMWEHSEHAFVEFDPRSVVRFILDPSRVDCWTPQGPAVHYLAAVNEFGRSRVEAEVRKATAN